MAYRRYSLSFIIDNLLLEKAELTYDSAKEQALSILREMNLQEVRYKRSQARQNVDLLSEALLYLGTKFEYLPQESEE